MTLIHFVIFCLKKALREELLCEGSSPSRRVSAGSGGLLGPLSLSCRHPMTSPSPSDSVSAHLCPFQGGVQWLLAAVGKEKEEKAGDAECP